MSLLTSIAYRFPALASRNFRIFWFGQFFSLIGTWMQNTTQPLLAYKLTGRPLDLGLIGFASTLPMLILALPGGVLVEHLDKRKTVIAMQIVMMLQAFTLAVLTLSGVIQFWHLMALSLVLGTASAIEITARQAMLIELVGREALPNAIALQSTIFNAARVLGPSLVAPFLILIKDSGEGWAFLANAISYLFVIIGLLFVNPQFRVPPKARDEHWIDELRAGQRYIIQNSTVGWIIVMVAVMGFFGFPLLQQIPVLAGEVLKQAGDTAADIAARNSALFTAQGIGAFAAALYISFFSQVTKKGKLMTIGQFAFIAALLTLAFVRNPIIAMVLIVILGFGTVTQLANMNTLIQVQVPDELRGRVFSTFLWAIQGVAPFGSLFVGWMAQTWGVPVAAFVSGVVCLISIGGIHLLNPAVRKTTA